MKSAVRYFRKDVKNNNNSFGINTNQIFVGGYSAGAVTAAHLSVIDEGEVPEEFQSFFEKSGGIEEIVVILDIHQRSVEQYSWRGN